MATCKEDCIHYEACKSLLEALGYTVNGEGVDADKRCETFTDKSLFSPLPCNIGDEMYEIDILRPSPKIQKVRVVELHRYDWKPPCWYIIVSNGQYNSYGIPETDIGATLFWTREEAEAMLKKRYG